MLLEITSKTRPLAAGKQLSEAPGRLSQCIDLEKVVYFF